MDSQLPDEIILSFSLFDFGCAGIYEKRTNQLYELVSTKKHAKIRQLIYQQNNVHGPSWVLMDPTHDIHFCLVISENGEISEDDWLCIGVPQKYLPTFQCKYKDKHEIISEMNNLPLHGTITTDRGDYFLELNNEWAKMMDNEDLLTAGLQHLSGVNIIRGEEIAKEWSELLLSSKNVQIDYFKDDNALTTKIDSDKLTEGSKEAFEITSIKSYLHDNLLSKNANNVNNLPAVSLRMNVMLSSNNTELYFDLWNFGLTGMAPRIELMDSEMMGSLDVFSPKTITSSDEEGPFTLEFPEDQDLDDDDQGLGFLRPMDDEDENSAGALSDEDDDDGLGFLAAPEEDGDLDFDPEPESNYEFLGPHQEEPEEEFPSFDDLEAEQEPEYVNENGETCHSLKLKLRQIERIKRNLLRGKKVDTDLMKLVAQKAEIEKQLDDAKINQMFQPLRDKVLGLNKENEPTGDEEVNDAISKFVNEIDGNDGGNSGGLFGGGNKRNRRRRRKKPALPQIMEE